MESNNGHGDIERYQYTPLTATNSIRLIELDPGEADEELQCAIWQTQLNEAPPFEAVSYTWKDHDWPITRPLERIVCFETDEFEQLLVTPNCAAALRRLRRPNRSRVLWIDSICINQTDNAEKASQVLMMPQIYAKARQVVIHLGDDADGSQLVMEMARNEQWFGGRGLPRGEPPRIQAWELAIVRAFISRRWFTRVWILQEVFEAKEAVILCGKQEVSWKKFAYLFFNYTHIIMGSSLSVLIPRVMQMDPWSKRRPPLLAVLQRARHSSATDPRDMIFAVVGLSNASPEACLIPDYSKSVEQVYEETAEYLLRESGLLLLSSVQNRSKIADLPSWVPDWSQEPEHAPAAWFDEEVMQWNRKKSAGGAPELANLEIIPAVPTPILKVRGFRLDTISQVGEKCKRLDFHWKNVIRSWLAMRSTHVTNLSDKEARKLAAEAILPMKGMSEKYLEMMFNDGRFYSPDSQAQQSTEEKVRGHVTGRRFLITESGHMGLGTLEAKVGDLVCIFLGGATPFVLRPRDNTYELIGECIINSVSNGEVMRNGSALLHEDFLLR